MISARDLTDRSHSQLDQWRTLPGGYFILLISYSLVVFGSPMPPKITWLQIVMGCGLLTGGLMLSGRVFREALACKRKKAILVLVSLLLLIPLSVALVRGNAITNVMRDVIPVMFLLVMPVFLTISIPVVDWEKASDLLVIVLLFVGIVTTLTYFSGLIQMVGSPAKLMEIIHGDLQTYETHATHATHATQTKSLTIILGPILLKTYDPAMLFAALFFGNWGISLIVRSWRWLLAGCMLLAIGTLIAYGFMVLGLRAYSIFYFMSLFAMAVLHFKERGVYMILLPIMALVMVLIWPQIENVLNLLWLKEQAVGANGKLAEWHAVVVTILASPQTTLFGTGWGGVLNDPILFNQPTRFTHSMLSFFILKSGITGLLTLLATLSILLFGGKKLGKPFSLPLPRQILLLSCMPPLLIGILFEPTYKMLSYGIVLSLFILQLPLADQAEA